MISMYREDIYEYKYLNDSVAKNREEALCHYIESNQESQLDLYGLSFLGGLTNLKSNIVKSICKSTINPEIVLNNYQLELISVLMSGKNLFLSAPTSFGKTFIVLEYIKRNIDSFKNIVFVVPTIALMNELVFKINKYFSSSFNICINEQEDFLDKNIFIFVPERSGNDFLSKIKKERIQIDLLVFDEIYKLNALKDSSSITRDDRIITMNKAYLKMVSSSKQIVLLGPFIKEVKFEKTRIPIVKYYSNFMPVYNKVDCKNRDEWIQLLFQNKQCLVYFSSPSSIYTAVKEFVSKTNENPFYCSKYKNEILYLESKCSKDWFAIDALKRGYGIHHGKIDMFLRRFFEDQYRKNELKGLFCTSTLMEGINTPTQSLIVMEKTRSVFELNNLIGRVGRLTANKPITGHIFLCDDNAKTMYQSSNIKQWLSLNILAENTKPINNEEVLFLNKKYADEKKQKDFERRIKRIVDYSRKTKEQITETDLKFTIMSRFVSEDFRNKFNACDSVYKCVQLGYTLMGKTLEFFYSPSLFTDLELRSDKSTFSAILYITKLLFGNSVKECVDDFNEHFNKMLNKTNINLFIDALNETISYIKFKLVKTCDYFNFFGVDIAQNKSLGQYVVFLGNFAQADIVDKILEDLGIEAEDFQSIKKALRFGQNQKVSTSIVIQKIKDNKTAILHMNISPFTKRNIISICS